MTKRILLSCLVCLAALSVYLKLKRTDKNLGLYQYQKNVIKSQNYLFSTAIKSVLIGTSLSDKLSLDSIPGLYNLSLSGLNVLDAMKVLEMKPALPSTLFVESNFCFRSVNKGFQDQFSYPMLMNLKRYLPILQENNQPVSLFKNMFSPEKKSSSHGSDLVVEPRLHSELLAFQATAFTNINLKLLNANEEELMGYTDRITRRAVDIYFYELPVDSSLENLPLATFTREKISTLVSHNARLHFIRFSPTLPVKTLDGIHLNTSSANELSAMLKSFAYSNMKN